MKQKLLVTGITLFALFLYSCGEKLTLEQQVIKDISNITSIKDCNNITEEVEISNVNFDSSNLTPVYGSDNMYVISVEFDHTFGEEIKHIENSYVYFKHGESYDFSKVVGGCEN